jgi:hypothetical protein
MFFSIGGLFGVILAGLAYRNQDLMSLDLLGDISLDSILDVLPPGIIKEASDIRVSAGKWDFCWIVLTGCRNGKKKLLDRMRLRWDLR